MPVQNPQRQLAAPSGLVVGALAGVAGTFASSAALRGAAKSDEKIINLRDFLDPK